MKSFVRDSRLLYTVKFVAALFNAPATWHVFTQQFERSGRGQFEVVFSTIMAILLIDAFFLAVLYFIESKELSIRERLPYALTSVGLAVAMLVIGYQDEGGLAFAPRLGFLGLILADLLAYSTEAWSEYFSRDAIEKRLRDRQVLARRRSMLKAYDTALKDLFPTFIDVQYERELAQLNRPQEQPVVEERSIEQLPLLEEVEQGVYQLANGHFGWKNGDDTLHEFTATGKPYTKQGAYRARQHALKSTEESHVSAAPRSRRRQPGY